MVLGRSLQALLSVHIEVQSLEGSLNSVTGIE